jgi:hypothetical protein
LRGCIDERGVGGGAPAECGLKVLALFRAGYSQDRENHTKAVLRYTVISW